MAPSLTTEQQSCLAAILEWLHSDPPELTLGGYAGTGKTTLIARLLSLLPTSPAVATFTGKAASVLKRKGVASAQTLHSYLYTFNELAKADEPRFIPKTDFDEDLLIVDEASMVATDVKDTIDNNFLSYQGRPTGRKVLYVGDHGQLEPVGENPNLMRDPTHKLETVHRQALDSPIIRFAHHLRSNNPASSFTEPTDLALHIGPRSALKIEPDFQVICAFNATRASTNAIFRDVLGYTGEVLNEGERVICLRNNKHYGIFNGMMGTVTRVHSADARLVHFKYVPDGLPPVHVEAWAAQFGADKTYDLYDWRTHGSLPLPAREIALFDYAYCITAHKSQGSEWDKIAVLEEPSHIWSMPRWRYTAATRASKTLHWYLP